MSWIYTLLLPIVFMSGTAIAESSPCIIPSILSVQNTNNTVNKKTPLKITVTTKAPYFTDENDGFLDLLLSEIGRRLDIEFDVLKNIPPARALCKLNQGNTDGDFPRVAGLEKIYPSIIYVPEKIVDFNFVAYSYKECPYPISFDLMRKARVGLVIGWKIYEQQTKNFSKLTTVVKPSQLYKLLSRKRIQYALHERYIGNKFIADLMLENDIYECAPPLLIKPMYLYLNKKHRALIPEISRVLKEIKADGTYQWLADETLHIN